MRSGSPDTGSRPVLAATRDDQYCETSAVVGGMPRRCRTVRAAMDQKLSPVATVTVADSGVGGRPGGGVLAGGPVTGGVVAGDVPGGTVDTGTVVAGPEDAGPPLVAGTPLVTGTEDTRPPLVTGTAGVFFTGPSPDEDASTPATTPAPARTATAPTA